MSTNLKNKILVYSLLFLILPLQIQALTAPDLNDSPVYNYSSYEIIPGGEGRNYNLTPACEKIEGRFFNEINECIAICDECVLRDNGCWYCLDSTPEFNEEKSIQTNNNKVFWQQVKNWLFNLWNNFLNIFQNQPQKKDGENESKDKQEKNDLSKKITEFLETEQRGENINEKTKEELEQNLKKRIKSARSLAELFKLRELASWWCVKKHGLNGEGLEVCEKSLANLIRQKGDKFKEEELAKINEENISPETFQKMRSLYALLASAQNTQGEGTFFSTKNIINVRKKLREKAQVFLNKALLKANWNEIEAWFDFVLAYTRVSDNQGSGLFKNSTPLTKAQYRYRRLLLLRLANMDICNPNQEKLNKLKEKLKSGRGCEVKLGSKEACQKLAQGNLEETYKILYKKDQSDEANNLEENKVSEPINCEKFKEVSKKEIEEKNDNEEEVNIGTNISYETEKTQKPENDTENKDIIDCNNGLCDVPEKENDINIDQEETIENINEGISTSSPIENNEKIDKICQFETTFNDITGWSFIISSCDQPENRIYDCILECGLLPPQKIFNQEERLCYETAGGFIDYNLEVPCRYDQAPPEEIEVCVNNCLNY